MTAPERDSGVPPTVSAIVVCFNEERNIGACLDSLRWCDEIVVVDSFSTDRTVEICRQYTDRVIQRPWAGYRDQKAFAHSLATKDWVLLVDSDERVTPELRDEIKRELALHGSRYAGVSVPRLVFYLHRWWWLNLQKVPAYSTQTPGWCTFLLQRDLLNSKKNSLILFVCLKNGLPGIRRIPTLATLLVL